MALVPSSSHGVDLSQANVWTANQTAPAFIASGLTGATAASRYVGATSSGAPASGTFAVGDFVIDQTGVIYVCTGAGSPGTWTTVGGVSQATLAAAVGGVVWTNIVKQADESVSSNTTPQVDDELVIALTSGGLYEIELFIVYASPAGGTTPLLKFALGEDGTLRGSFGTAFITTTPAGVWNSLSADSTAVNNAQTAATNRAVFAKGEYVSGGGTFRLLWAQGSSNASATIVRAGSVLRYRRIL